MAPPPQFALLPPFGSEHTHMAIINQTRMFASVIISFVLRTDPYHHRSGGGPCNLSVCSLGAAATSIPLDWMREKSGAARTRLLTLPDGRGRVWVLLLVVKGEEEAGAAPPDARHTPRKRTPRECNKTLLCSADYSSSSSSCKTLVPGRTPVHTWTRIPNWIYSVFTECVKLTAAV